MSNKAIENAKTYSNNILDALRGEFKEQGLGEGFCIVVVGSFARKEASESSDLDYFLLTKQDVDISEKVKQSIKALVQEKSFKPCGDTETFGESVPIDELTSNIGGIDDSNQRLTRRMLFLLEGSCLYDNTLFKYFRKELIKQYIKDTVSDHKSSRFLLNDIIRFYRTMATDFENKASERNKKPNIRNIKLTFSRKLLYFSGIIVIAETVQKTREDKIKETLLLLEMPPLERVKYIFEHRADKALMSYNQFLAKISNSETRKNIENDPDTRKNGEFRKLKNQSKHFSWALSAMLKDVYDDAHPIHHSLIF